MTRWHHNHDDGGEWKKPGAWDIDTDEREGKRPPMEIRDSDQLDLDVPESAISQGRDCLLNGM